MLYELTYTIKTKHGQFVSDSIDSVRKHEELIKRIVAYASLRGLHLELVTDVHAVPPGIAAVPSFDLVEGKSDEDL